MTAAGETDQTVLADVLETSSAGALTDMELRIDTAGTWGALDGSDLRLPIGQRTTGAGTQLVYAFWSTTAVGDGSIHAGLPTLIVVEITYTGASTFGTANARITFASPTGTGISLGGTGILTFSFNPTE